MVLEASFLCIDNSDYMRNGDFAPSRMEAQLDAVNLDAAGTCSLAPQSGTGGQVHTRWTRVPRTPASVHRRCPKCIATHEIGSVRLVSQCTTEAPAHLPTCKKSTASGREFSAVGW